MEVKRTRRQIIVDTGVKQHKLTLSDLKKEFGEKEIKLSRVEWEISENRIVFEVYMGRVRKGSTTRRIAFDAERGVFTGERLGIHVNRFEYYPLMAEVEFNSQKHEILWEDVRKLFNVKKFKARSVGYESVNSVFYFQVWNLTHAYKFTFDPQNKEITDCKVHEIEKLLSSPKEKKTRTFLDFPQSAVLLRVRD